MTKDKASKDEDGGESFKKQYGNKKVSSVIDVVNLDT